MPVLALLLALAPPLPPPGPLPSPQGGPGWVFQSRDHADLWFGSLAQIGYEGIGPLPLYNALYAAELQAAKRRTGVVTSLDRVAVELRRSLSADSAFEVLHFVPVYFAAAGRVAMLDALEAVSAARGAVRVDDPAAQFGAAAVASVLTTAAQRSRLGDLVRVMREEWDAFYGSYWLAGAARRDSATARAQALWDADLAPVLADFLGAARLRGGLVLVSPALGRDGRAFAGRPQDPDDNVVAVRLPADTGAAVAVLATVREQCAPLASALVATAPPPSRVEAEGLSARVSVQCGAALVARYASRWVDLYRQSFAGTQDFERAFRLDSTVARALEERLR